ncbi:MAG: NADH-quinone oxidoreductase subunit L [Thermodesulfobacteriota bacterium]|nr:NADH-quinone oxidoreductase subunit L [Thermodesulfobacteriota bacterium]
MDSYVWLVPLFPLLAVLINGLLGIRFKKGTIGLVACTSLFLSFIVSALIFYQVLQLPADQRNIEVVLYTWIGSGTFNVDFGFLIDPLSLVMMLVVSGVSFLIHLYSCGYMHDDPGFRRYFVELNLFTFFMLLLVSANNYLLMFIGWEGVGLCSYLLIGFWFERKAPADAGKKAFIVNRVGDFAFLLGMMYMYKIFGTLNYLEVFEKAPQMFTTGSLVVTTITLLLFAGATGKSAQIPLYTWLPDAMEGPTPVSALIHAATMVTAGVYMVVRSNVLYVLAPISMEIVAIIGAVTALFAATIALTQFDIKRVLAYSTISQLGYMFLAAGVGAFSAAIFHLMTHAFFKALLFLGAGSVMHALAGELDMRKMGGVKKYTPTTYWTFLIATLAISGIFPFAGFFSKDEILWSAFTKNHFLWGLGAFTALLTAFYMFRALYMTFHGTSRMDEEVEKHAHESPKIMTVPLTILAVLSVIGGFVGIPIIKGANVFGDFLSPIFTSVGGKVVEATTHAHTATHAHEAAHAAGHSIGLELSMMGVSLIIAIFGILVAYTAYLKVPDLPRKIAAKFRVIHTFLLNKYYIDELYDFLFVNSIKSFCLFFWKIIDTILVDGLVNGVGFFVTVFSSIIKRIQTGYVQTYALYILIGVVILVFYYIS